jgi:putative membrane protein
MYGPYNHGWMFDGGFGMLFGGLWMILVLLIPLLLLAALLRYLFTKSRGDGGRESAPARQTPLDVLKEVYARGEISREEFLQKRDDLLEK